MLSKNIETKTKEEAFVKIGQEFKCTIDKLIVTTTEEEIGLFKGKKFITTAVSKKEIIDYVKEKLLTITDLMEIDIKVESLIRHEKLIFVMYCDNMNILIGKDGKNLISIENIIKQDLFNKTNMNLDIYIDGANYRQDKKKRLETLAIKLAEDVKNTRISTKLDYMSYSNRKIIHNKIKQIPKVISYSLGEEPNRYVVIEYKK
ncbi:MAG: protein jag [Bacilli bacterium]